MEDAEIVLKELRIDWETVLTEEFNPLKEALEVKRNTIKQSNYRNIYHKVERVMEKIIEETYKGFSDSVLSYMECYNLTSRGLVGIDEMISIVERLKNIKIYSQDYYENFKETEHLNEKHKICEDLVEIKNKYEEFKLLYKKGALVDAAVNLQIVREIIKQKQLYKIKGVDSFYSEVESDVKEMCEDVFSKVDLFIYQDKPDNKDFFRVVVILNRILQYDRFIYTNLEKNIFKSIEHIIYKVYKGEIDDELDDVEETTLTCEISQVPVGKSSIFVSTIYKLTSKIMCFYNVSPHVTVESNGDNKKVLVKRIVNKLDAIKSNINYIKRLAEAAFANLDEQSKNYYNSYQGFMIFCPEGFNNVQRIIYKVINRFLDVYTDNDKRNIEVGEFENINIVDNIDYDEEVDKKYPLYDRLVSTRAVYDEKEEDFTLIFKPNIDICIDFYEFVRDESIKQRCKKYIDHKGDEVLRMMILVFQDQRWDRLDHNKGVLWFVTPFFKIIQEVENIVRVFGVVSLGRTHSLIEKKMSEKFNALFKAKFIVESIANLKTIDKILVITDRSSLSLIDVHEAIKLKPSKVSFPLDLETLEGLEVTDICQYNDFIKIESGKTSKYCVKLPNGIFESLKNFVVNSSIDNKELLCSKTKYECVVYTINTLVEISNCKQAYLFAVAFKINIMLEIIYHFDIYYREGIFSNKLYITKIVNIIKDTFNTLDLSEIFDLLDFYIVKSRSRLNVKTKEDFENFIFGVKLLDECLSDLNTNLSLRNSLEFLQNEFENFK